MCGVWWTVCRLSLPPVARVRRRGVVVSPFQRLPTLVCIPHSAFPAPNDSYLDSTREEEEFMSQLRQEKRDWINHHVSRHFFHLRSELSINTIGNFQIRRIIQVCFRRMGVQRRHKQLAAKSDRRSTGVQEEGSRKGVDGGGS